MSWTRLDDGFDENEHILDLTDQEFRLYVCAITCARRNKTGGLMSRARAAGLARKHGLPEAAIDGLVEKGRWEPADGGWLIHDFPKYGPPADLSEKRAEARRQGAASRWHRSGKPMANARQTDGTGTPVPVPVPVDNPPVAPPGGPVERVFDEWKRAHGKNARTELDGKRRVKIAAALKAYPEADVLDAVRWTIRVEGKPYEELTLLLRDAAHIEQCRDAVRAQRQPAERELPRWEPPVVDHPMDPALIRDLMPARLRRAPAEVA
jgi:hypothetical protein